MSAKKSIKSTKDKIFGMIACGSGKKNRPLSNMDNAPEDKPEDEGPIDHNLVTVRAYKGHEYSNDSPQKPSSEENGEEDGLVEISYNDLKLIGKGTFGVVYRAKLYEKGELIAIKKVFDDKRYKNRELVFMRRLQHCNICDLKYYFYSEDPGCRKGERFLNMVLEYVPKTLFTISKCDGTFSKPLLDPSYIKLYIYQLLRSLNYLHSMNICHRDIKPQNMLIDPATHEVKLCDFGSAKELLKSESNVAYICSRYYRAPELIFGAKDYTSKIDMWSAGCILGELYMGHPIFPGASGPDQMVEIMKILGTPTLDDIRSIHHSNKDMVLPPTLMPMPWSKVFTKSTPSADAVSIMAQLLVFNPDKRLVSLEAMEHPFFHQLKNRDFILPDGKPPPPLFDFTPEELEMSPTIKERLQPIGWEKNEDISPHSNFPLTPSSTGNENLKSKIVNLARNSFRKASFRRDKRDKGSNDFEAPNAYQFEESDVEIGEYGGQEYGEYGERRDGDYGERREGMPQGGDEDFTDEIQKLNLREADKHDVERMDGGGNEEQKKKKKNKSKSHHHDNNDEISIGGDVVDDNEVKVKKKKKKKRVEDAASYEGGYDNDEGGTHGDYGNDGGGTHGDYGNDGVGKYGDHEEDVVSYEEEGRKKLKKTRGKVPEEMVVPEVATHKKKSTKKMMKKQEENGDVIQLESHVVEMDGGSGEKKKKKKKKRNESFENEV